MRSAMHQAGASALSQLLRFPVPEPDERAIPCPCGQQAFYHELRSKTVLTAVGTVEVVRPYYLCRHCHEGQFPADQELDIVRSDFSPGVRRMQALVGQDAPFDHGREQMKLLAGLEVTTKSVERVAESIGADIARQEQQEIERAVQLDLPMIVGEPVPILYVQMDGTGVPVVKKETAGCKGKIDGLSAHTREAKLGCVVPRPSATRKAIRSATPLRPPTSAPSKVPSRSVGGFMSRLGNAAGAAPPRRSFWAMARNGSGTWPANTFPAPFKSSICFTPASTCGTWHACFIPPTPNAATPGLGFIRNVGWTKAKSPSSLLRFARFKPLTPISPRNSVMKPTISPPTRHV
jgi:hypothetical protein